MLRGVLLISPESWRASQFTHSSALELQVADIISEVFANSLCEELFVEGRAQVQTLDTIPVQASCFVLHVYASHTSDRAKAFYFDEGVY